MCNNSGGNKGGIALKNKSLFPLILSMVIFGSVGVFVSFLPSELSRGIAVLSRSVVAFVFLLVFCLITKRPPSLRALCRNPLLLPLSGVALLLSAWISRERPGLFGYLGALLILGSAAVCELDFGNFKRKSKKKNG